jgi:hypothetical protein
MQRKILRKSRKKIGADLTAKKALTYRENDLVAIKKFL